MPFPNPRVLSAFLREYLYYRQTNTWSTTAGMITAYVRNDASIKTGQCIEINRLFYNESRLKTFNGWIDLVFTLGEQGREQSLFAETLQAIRSYIVSCLTQSEHNAALQELLKELRQQATQLDSDIMKAMEAKEAPKSVQRLEKKYYDTLLKLADLGDHTAICHAQRLGLFSKLEHPNLGDRSLPMFNDLNGNIPFAYHDNGYLFFYYRFIKSLPKWQVSFEDFVRLSESASPDIEEPVQVAVDSKTSGLTSAIGGFVSTLWNRSNSPSKVSPPSLSSSRQPLPIPNLEEPQVPVKKEDSVDKDRKDEPRILAGSVHEEVDDSLTLSDNKSVDELAKSQDHSPSLSLNRSH